MSKQEPVPDAELPRKSCKYGDPLCPCQDGDMCHYEGENPMSPPTPEPVPDAELDNAIAFAETYSRRGDYPRFDANWDKIIGGIAALRQQNADLRTRLEATPYGPSTDGIACRDETIRQQDLRMEELRQQVATQEQLIDERAERIAREPVPDTELDALEKSLRAFPRFGRMGSNAQWLRNEPICTNAADAISALRQQNAELRTGLLEQKVRYDEWKADWDDVFETVKRRAETAERERDELRAALQILHDETADYVRLNNLGDPYSNQSMRMARDAMAKQAEGK